MRFQHFTSVFSNIKERLPGTTCSGRFECRTELSCLDGTCNCPDTEFLKDHKCLPSKFKSCFLFSELNL